MSATTTLTVEEMTTEDKILQAAIAIFTQKGAAGTKTRDIAEAAGLKNVATLHYYFRTKELLFSKVAQLMMDEFTEIHREVFCQEKPLKEKIRLFVDRYTDLFIRKPHLPMFCLSETERNPAAFREIVDFREADEAISKQLETLQQAGKIRPISTQGLISCLVGMTIYPFLSKATTLHIGGLTEEQYRALLEEQRQRIPEMIIGYLFVA